MKIHVTDTTMGSRYPTIEVEFPVVPRKGEYVEVYHEHGVVCGFVSRVGYHLRPDAPLSIQINVARGI